MHSVNPDLLRKFIARQTNEDESVEVTKWLDENNLSPEDLDYALENPKAIWIFDQIDTANNWEIVKKKTVAKPKVLLMRHFLRVAASILILVAIAGIGFKVMQYANRPLVVSNNSSKVLLFTLPDSSLVSLNKHSKLTYFRNFSKKRNIQFEGEAFFEIKRDIHRPFVVKTAESEIRVLGTSFSVETDLKNTCVIVESGKVALYSTHQLADTILLEKGDKGVFKAQSRSIEKQRNKDLNFLAWKDHRLTFEKTPIANVIADLENYFKIKVNVKSPEIYKLNYTSQFTNPTLSEVLKEMELVLNISFEVTGNNVLLSLK